MNILVTGGYGFIGTALCERLVKEKHQLYIIDDLSSPSPYKLHAPHVFYQKDIAERDCEMIFQNNNIDILIHLAAKTDLKAAEEMPYDNCQSNILGLINMLDLAVRYKIKKFVFVSSTAVYGDSEDRTLSETSPLIPRSLYAINKASGEAYCKIWRENYGLETMILRLSNVYGPKQSITNETEVIARLLQQIKNEHPLTVHEEAPQRRDYLYIDDAVIAISLAATKSIRQPLLNIVSGTSHSTHQILEILGRHFKLPPQIQEKNRAFGLFNASFSNTLAKECLAWTPRYDLETGLLKTKESRLPSPSDKKSPPAPSIWTAYRPYIENAVIFLFMSCLAFANLRGGFLDFRLGMDYNYVYIAIMGLLYGKKQSLPATVLSAFLFCGTLLAKGADIVTILYQVQYLTHLAAYLAIGVVTGYVTDRRNMLLSEADHFLTRLEEKYRFLQKLYQECVKTKDSLYNQIVNSEDSLGKIYSIVRSLDSLAPEDIYTNALDILRKIMHCEAIDIYSVNADASFWRIKLRSFNEAPYLENSICIAKSDYAQKVMQSKGVFINKRFSGPCMAAPIFHQGKIIAIIQLYNLPFESMNLHHSNLLRVTSMLISDALAKAYRYEILESEKKYLPGTQLLLPAEFKKLLAEMAKRNIKYSQPYVLLRVSDKKNDLRNFYHDLANIIRAEDYAGLDDDDNILLLLQNVTTDLVPSVQKRLADKGLQTIYLTGDKNDR